jgi:hypothetical protein
MWWIEEGLDATQAADHRHFQRATLISIIQQLLEIKRA